MSGFTIRLADFPRDRAAALAFIDGLQAFEFEVEPNRRLDATVAAEHMEVLDKRLAEHGGAIFIAQDVAGTALGWSVVHETSDDIYVIAPERRTVMSVSLRTASPGIITGCMLAFARVAGETAPLLFTAFGNQFWSFRLNEPIAALPLQIYVYATGPYDEWHRLAWAGALVLIVMIMVSVTLVRIFANRGVLKGGS